MSFREDKELDLYRFEYLSDGIRAVDWVWLGEGETFEYLANDDSVSGLSFREASNDEKELYESAFSDGYGLGSVENEIKHSNEVYYKFVGLKGDLELETEKVFTCGDCKTRMIDFEPNVARFGPYYITKEDAESGVLWFVCVECAGK